MATRGSCTTLRKIPRRQMTSRLRTHGSSPRCSRSSWKRQRSTTYCRWTTGRSRDSWSRDRAPPGAAPHSHIPANSAIHPKAAPEHSRPVLQDHSLGRNPAGGRRGDARDRRRPVRRLRFLLAQRQAGVCLQLRERRARIGGKEGMEWPPGSTPWCSNSNTTESALATEATGR